MSRFEYRREVEKELLRHKSVAVAVENYCRAGALAAIGFAPRGTHGGEHYADTIAYDVVPDPRRGVRGRVFSYDFAAHLIEFGSINNPPYAPLRRGIESTGLRVTDRGRAGSSP